jgi:hypothetical protein
VVQASGDDYPQALAQALAYADVDDELGEALVVDSGELAVFSAACDGTGPYSVPLVPAGPGPVPAVHGPPSRETDPGLLLTGGELIYQLKVRWYTELDDDSCFARWLLIPNGAADR